LPTSQREFLVSAVKGGFGRAQYPQVKSGQIDINLAGLHRVRLLS
jgi:hypothetical protein